MDLTPIPLGLDRLESAPARALNASNTQPDKVRKAAQDFEALLLSSWLQEFQHGLSGSFGADLDPAAGSLEGMGTTAIAQALAASGGIGIAKMILEQLRPGGTEAEKPL